MDYEDAKKEVDEANDRPETEFCPVSKEACRKDCKLYIEAYVKQYRFGMLGVSHVGVKSSCGLKR